MKKVKELLISATLLLSSLIAPIAVTGMVAAEPNIDGSLCAGASFDVNQTDCSDTSEASDQVNSLLTTVINIFSLVVGVVAVIMIIVGGFKYITSGGDSGNVSGAKNTILYAIVGLVIVALAQVIVQFVLGKTTGTS